MAAMARRLAQALLLASALLVAGCAGSRTSPTTTASASSSASASPSASPSASGSGAASAAPTRSPDGGGVVIVVASPSPGPSSSASLGPSSSPVRSATPRPSVAAIVDPRGRGISIHEGDPGQASLDGGRYRIAWYAPDCTSLRIAWSTGNDAVPVPVTLPAGEAFVTLPQGLGYLVREATCTGDYTIRFEAAG